MPDFLVPIWQRARFIIYICIYNLFKIIHPLKNNKIILASNRSMQLEGNLLWIYNELKEDSKYNIKIYSTNKPNTIFNIKLMIDMSNAKYTIIDDFFPIMYVLKIRKNAKLIQVWHALRSI